MSGAETVGPHRSSPTADRTIGPARCPRRQTAGGPRRGHRLVERRRAAHHRRRRSGRPETPGVDVPRRAPVRLVDPPSPARSHGAPRRRRAGTGPGPRPVAGAGRRRRSANGSSSSPFRPSRNRLPLERGRHCICTPPMTASVRPASGPSSTTRTASAGRTTHGKGDVALRGPANYLLLAIVAGAPPPRQASRYSATPPCGTAGWNTRRSRWRNFSTMTTSEIATVLAWHDAFNERDLDTLILVSSDDIEFGDADGAGQGPRGRCSSGRVRWTSPPPSPAGCMSTRRGRRRGAGREGLGVPRRARPRRVGVQSPDLASALAATELTEKDFAG